MNVAAVTLASLSLASAASLAVAQPATDVDYLKASRCRGLAVGLGVDASAINSYLKHAAGGRSPAILARADEEFDRAKREARGADGKDRLQAELSGPCAAYASASTGASAG
ncbi:MAG TPA: hypothetical protein VJS38_10380 [Phenylobacterium sp.]|uniref:hypothetical protein n=1 Tax=Phenylobacterium sp. TaxID=1871053 RepID=UPI002B495B13|nr:hypothetical protein [Phenylobacterium sp.]HKR88571.1 hypothetical protein [Phenylobacterium sp.]HKT53129.1 hypothetical protein [Caulobacteraceae bacterium]